jgi:hypothetical protein
MTDRDVIQRIEVERRIMQQVVKDAIAAGFGLSVDDGGEDFAITNSKDEAAVMACLHATDDDALHFHRDGAADTCGWVKFVYGNDRGENVISDYTVNLEDYLIGAEDLAREIVR